MAGAGNDGMTGQIPRTGEGKKLSQNRESLVEKLFLFLIKTVFAKFDNRLG